MFKVDELLKATAGKLIAGKKDSRISGISVDSRTIKRGEAFLAFKGNNFDGHNFIAEAIKKGASCVIFQSSAVSCRLSKKAVFIRVKDTTKALGDLARFKRRQFDIPVIAVTGSNGKTTVKEMLAGVLSKRFKVLKNEGTKNNQIGLPLTLLNLNRTYDIAILEIGTNHFGEVEYLARICLANIGIITNVAPAHLEYLRSLKGVFLEKYSLIKNLKKPYITILNADDNLSREKILKKKEKPFILSFGIKRPADFRALNIKFDGKGINFLVKDFKFTLKTPGYFNIYNALCAIGVGRIFEMSYADIARQLALFDFPQGRLNLVTLNGIKFIDDTYNSNPFSLRQALDTIKNLKTKRRKIFVMGDMLELGRYAKSFHILAGKMAKAACDVFITVGRLSKFAADYARKSGFNHRQIFACASLEEARNILFKRVTLKPDDIVLVKGSRAMKMEGIFR